MQDRVDLTRFVERAGEELGTWVKADYGLEVMCRGEDIAGSFHLRGQGHILASVFLPCEDWMSVPGTVGMEVWTNRLERYGVVHLRSLGEPSWWSMRA